MRSDDLPIVRSDGVPADRRVNGVVLLGRASYGGRSPDELADLARRVGHETDRWTRFAVIDGASPSVIDVLDEACLAGLELVHVVPTSIPTERELHLWIRRSLDRWRATRRETDLGVVVLEPMARHDATVTAIAAIVSAAEDHPPVAHRRDDEPPNDPSWSAIPRHDRHLLVCRGPRCTLLGASEVARSFADHVPDTTLTVSTGCLFPCNLGPVAVVHPDGTWYGGLDPASATEVALGHLTDGRPIRGHCIAPDGSRQQRPSSPTADRILDVRHT